MSKVLQTFIGGCELSIGIDAAARRASAKAKGPLAVIAVVVIVIVFALLYYAH
ncbi:MAG: hypothetical protein ABSA49_03165 [Rhizomicrobium sp.]|jgi:hypothetical protein